MGQQAPERRPQPVLGIHRGRGRSSRPQGAAPSQMVGLRSGAVGGVAACIGGLRARGVLAMLPHRVAPHEQPADGRRHRVRVLLVGRGLLLVATGGAHVCGLRGVLRLLVAHRGGARGVELKAEHAGERHGRRDGEQELRVERPRVGVVRAAAGGRRRGAVRPRAAQRERWLGRQLEQCGAGARRGRDRERVGHRHVGVLGARHHGVLDARLQNHLLARLPRARQPRVRRQVLLAHDKLAPRRRGAALRGGLVEDVEANLVRVRVGGLVLVELRVRLRDGDDRVCVLADPQPVLRVGPPARAGPRVEVAARRVGRPLAHHALHLPRGRGREPADVHLVEAAVEVVEVHPEGAVAWRPPAQLRRHAGVVLPVGRRVTPRAAPLGRRLAVGHLGVRVAQPHELAGAVQVLALEQRVDQVGGRLALARHRRRLALGGVLELVRGARQVALLEQPRQPRVHGALCDLLDDLQLRLLERAIECRGHAVAQVDAVRHAARQVLERPADAPRLQLLVAAVEFGERLLHEAERPGARLLRGRVRWLLRLDAAPVARHQVVDGDGGPRAVLEEAQRVQPRARLAVLQQLLHQVGPRAHHAHRRRQPGVGQPVAQHELRAAQPAGGHAEGAGVVLGAAQLLEAHPVVHLLRALGRRARDVQHLRVRREVALDAARRDAALEVHVAEAARVRRLHVGGRVGPLLLQQLPRPRQRLARARGRRGRRPGGSGLLPEHRCGPHWCQPRRRRRRPGLEDEGSVVVTDHLQRVSALHAGLERAGHDDVAARLERQRYLLHRRRLEL
eukprot:scaffold1535_cov61-Phaeocystis_antarctica.AAC.6